MRLLFACNVRRLGLLLLAFLQCAETVGREPFAEVIGDAHRKGVMILRGFVPNRGKINFLEDFSVKWSPDGESFYTLPTGFPRPESLFTSTCSTPDTVTVMIVVVGAFTVSDACFFPRTSGSFDFRWEISFQDPGAAPVILEHRVNVGEPVTADLAFIGRASDPALLRQLFGEDFFEKKRPERENALLQSPEGTDLRALTVIAQLLKATRVHEPWQAPGCGSPDSARKWADTLWPIAEEFPDSSYAPYVAYLAGCGYMTCLTHEIKQEDGSIVTPDATKNPFYAQADKAFSFAAERADDYLKPRVLYFRGFLLGMAAAWEDSNRVLDEALSAAPGEGTIRKIVNELRESFNRTRAKREQ